LNTPQNARDVDRDDFIELLGRDIGKRQDLGDPGGVDDDVKTAEFLFGVPTAA
jgi:hypothetical protein